MLSTVRKCLVLLSARERWRWAGLIPLAMLSAVMEAAGAGAVFGLIKIISDPAQASVLPVTSALYPLLPRQDAQAVVFWMAVGVVLFYILKNAFLVAVASQQSRVASESTVAVSTRMLERYLAAPFALHLRRNSAELIRNMTSSIDTVFGMVMLPAINIFVEALIVLGIVAVLVMTAPALTLAAAGILFTLLAVLLRLTRRTLIRWGSQEQHLRKTILQNLQQSLGGIKEVRLRGRERFFQGLFDNQQHALARVRHLNSILSTASRVLIETVFVVGMLLVVVVVTLRGSTGPQIVPVLGLYAYAGFRVIPSVNRILMHLNSIRYSSPVVEQLHEDFVGIRQPPALAAETPEGEALAFTDCVALEHVSYSYDGTRAPVVQDISLTIRRGESVGIVGPTGAGKSTMIDLLLGLLPPAAGRVTVDGIDIATALRAWQRKIGYVPQAVYLTDDRLRRNIGFGLLDEEIDPDKVHAAVRMAQLEDLVAALPRGLDTVVGERGVRLSGGERQRVAIARALYHEPELLVFDEATASLDNQTERELTRAIETLHGQKTLIIIAHRLSTVRNCDRLVFLLHGRVAGVGSFDELLQCNADFRNMAVMTDTGEGP
jgi:ATP-binding cassette, subfamily B, bacterial PglK